MRLGGVSPDPFGELNVGAHTGDAAERVRINRRRISNLLSGGQLDFVRQVHGTRVVDRSQADAAADDEADAVISARRQRFLTILVADCQAVMLVDPVRRVVANVHSGWRGSVGNIIGKTVAEMVGAHGCRPQHILAGVGPSLGPCCAEFVNYRKEIPGQYWPYKDGRDHFDFWAVSRDQLLEAGVRRRHVHLSRICTRCNPHLFYSYRQMRQTGRFAAVIGMTKGHGKR